MNDETNLTRSSVRSQPRYHFLLTMDNLTGGQVPRRLYCVCQCLLQMNFGRQINGLI
jgi:hypothetical protein